MSIKLSGFPFPLISREVSPAVEGTGNHANTTAATLDGGPAVTTVTAQTPTSCGHSNQVPVDSSVVTSTCGGPQVQSVSPSPASNLSIDSTEESAVTVVAESNAGHTPPKSETESFADSSHDNSASAVATEAPVSKPETASSQKLTVDDVFADTVMVQSDGRHSVPNSGVVASSQETMKSTSVPSSLALDATDTLGEVCNTLVSAMLGQPALQQDNTDTLEPSHMNPCSPGSISEPVSGSCIQGVHSDLVSAHSCQGDSVTSVTTQLSLSPKSVCSEHAVGVDMEIQQPSSGEPVTTQASEALTEPTVPMTSAQTTAVIASANTISINTHTTPCLSPVQTISINTQAQATPIENSLATENALTGHLASSTALPCVGTAETPIQFAAVTLAQATAITTVTTSASTTSAHTHTKPGSSSTQATASEALVQPVEDMLGGILASDSKPSSLHTVEAPIQPGVDNPTDTVIIQPVVREDDNSASHNTAPSPSYAKPGLVSENSIQRSHGDLSGNQSTEPSEDVKPVIDLTDSLSELSASPTPDDTATDALNTAPPMDSNNNKNQIVAVKTWTPPTSSPAVSQDARQEKSGTATANRPQRRGRKPRSVTQRITLQDTQASCCTTDKEGPLFVIPTLGANWPMSEEGTVSSLSVGVTVSSQHSSDGQQAETSNQSQSRLTRSSDCTCPQQATGETHVTGSRAVTVVNPSQTSSSETTNRAEANVSHDSSNPRRSAGPDTGAATANTAKGNSNHNL